ncbi:zinc finger, CCHC-type containing protein [Tanacetum coccineum]
MDGNTVKDITTNFGKLDKFEGHDFRRWQKKMHFLLTTLKVVYVLTTPMPELLEDATVEAIRIMAKWENDDYICKGILNGMSDSLFDVYTNVESAKELQYTQHGLKIDESISVSSIIDKLPPSWKDFKHTLKHGKDDLSLVQLGSHLRIEESLRAQDSDKGKGKEVGSNKKPKLQCWKCGKTGHFKRNCRSFNTKNANADGSGKGSKDHSQYQAHVCKDRCWFKTYEPVEDGSVLNIGDDHFAPVHGKGSVVLEFRFGYYNNGMFMLNLNKVSDDSDSVYMSSSSTVVNSSLWRARLGHVYYKRMLEMSKDDLIPAIDENPRKCTTCMLTKITKQPFKSITRKSVILELIHSDLYDFHATPSLSNKKYVITFIDDASRFCYVYLLHAKDEALDKFRIYNTEVELQQNDLIKTLRTDRGGEYYDPVFFQSVGIIHETTTPYTPQQNGVAERKNRALKEMVNSMVPNKRNKTTPYEIWYKKRPNLSFFRVWGCRAVVRLPDPKRKTLGEKGIDCIFVGYAKHSKAYRFYVIEPNNSVSINSIIESRDVIFDENRFSSIPRPKDIIPNSVESQRDDHSDDVPSETPEPRKGKRVRKAKSYGSDFQLYLVEGSRDQVGSQYSYFYSIEEDPRTYDEAMQSWDAAFWKEAIDDEIGSIMENNTWVLSDLPPGCKPLGCKQKEGIDYFDTYAPVARITTIRLLLALAAIHNLVIHQMDVKTSFLNGDLDEEVYMKQPGGFVMSDNEHKVCKLVKSLYGLKQAPKHKFDDSGKGVIICLYVDDMLIFGTDQNQVDKTKKFLSSRFSMKDMGEADVILGIKIKRENNGIVITQSHYIEKILKKFNREYCSSVSTHMDPIEKLKPNTGKHMDQLEYSRAIGCLMYAMTSTRPDIAYAVDRLSKFTSIPSRHHWKAITRVFKYLRGTMNYGLSYVGYPPVLYAYSDASWINHVEDSSSTSGWVFLLGGGAISWASKKQTCITGSTMESEFIALAAAGKEA